MNKYILQYEQIHYEIWTPNTDFAIVCSDCNKIAVIHKVQFTVLLFIGEKRDK